MMDDEGLYSSADPIPSHPIRSDPLPSTLYFQRQTNPTLMRVTTNRNQRMSDDQSVVGRRRIYYDPTGGEVLICSDSEEEVIEEEEDKKIFARSEDYILWMAAQQVGLSDAVLDLLGQCFSKKPCDIKARYEALCVGRNVNIGPKNGDTAETSESVNPYLDKDLEGALYSFDNLFCRRCYVFDCRLHGCSPGSRLPD